MNHLQHETSPYLLQHAHNPVNWYAWKPEAFEKAKAEDKPILVSIGYSTCHWCHVMERESFENESIAEIMNEHFINIKVDREERPDVDAIYMEACQLINGGGCGWPLNCFLTPDGRPFYAGTYYPPQPAHNRPAWSQVLQNISKAFTEKRETVEDQANRLLEMIGNSDESLTGQAIEGLSKEQVFTPVLLSNVFEGLKRQFDKKYGGFGGAPKFPGAMSLRYLLHYSQFAHEEKALEHVQFSLDKMIHGGIYDQLGGGFARYTVDRAWLVPHFEKMLYDNALLVTLLSESYKLTQKELYRETIEETLAYIKREMTSEEGGFYSAQDADSEGEEGKFYVWQKAEVDAILGKEAVLFNEFYDVTDGGNWEGKNILWRQRSFEEFAEAKNLDVNELKANLAKARSKLFAERDKRTYPGLDDKILLDWNALMCSAHAQAYMALGKEGYRETAVRNINFLLERMQQPDGEGLFHTYKNGQAQYDAFLNDYAYLIEALIDVYHITFDTTFLAKAETFTEFVLEHFLDKASNLFYFTAEKQSDIVLRKKDLYDSAVPSGNSTMVRNLQRLGILLGQEDWKELAQQMLLALQTTVERYPTSFARWAQGMLVEVQGWHEVAIVGGDAKALAKALNAKYLPNKVVMASVSSATDYPLLEGKTADEATLIYVCKDYACQQPVKNVEEAVELMR